MRTGGLPGDFSGEVRLTEPTLSTFHGGGVTALGWKGGRFVMGYPLGMPVGVDTTLKFQVYLDGLLVEATGKPVVTLKVEQSVQHHVEVLGVAGHLAGVGQENVLTHMGGRRVRLCWSGSESEDVATYRVYGNGGDGEVDYGTALAEVEAAPGGTRLEELRWRSPELPDGVWRFGLRVVDQAGNEASEPATETDEVEITGRPAPPTQVWVEYQETGAKGTVRWN